MTLATSRLEERAIEIVTGGNAAADGDRAIRDVYGYIGRFVAYPTTHSRVAHALWIAHTYKMQWWESTPRLAFLSPEPGSGKSRALEVTAPLVPKAVHSINCSPAYLFRKIAEEPDFPPTVLFDEIDTVFGPKAGDHEELRGIMNAGHRKGATAGRCVIRGKEIITEDLPAYCALAVAGLGDLPDTILTRSVIVRMRRRSPAETVEPFRSRIHTAEAEPIRQRLEAWANTVEIKGWPELPAGVEDRNADVWEALIAIADAAGGDWPRLAREAAVALVSESKNTTPSLGVKLLSDLRDVFKGYDYLSTESILKALQEIEEAPWSDLKGKPIDPRRLARMLKPYGVEPTTVREAGKVPHKGYRREDLHDPWTRYLPSPPMAKVTSVTGDTEVVV